MTGTVLTKVYDAPPLCEKEVLRYAACKEADGATLDLLNECVKEARDKISYKLCYMTAELNIQGNECDFGLCKFESADLKKNLQGCDSAIIFAATLGAEFDRLIARYSRLSPAKALMLEALGNERIEALCDTFCRDMGLSKPRFSPGYGDLPIERQREIFALLDCQRRIGLTLNNSLLMSPSKSVTAIAGIGHGGNNNHNKCKNCSLDCRFRSEL